MPRKVALLNAAAASVVSVLYTEDGGSRFLRNAGKFVRVYLQFRYKSCGGLEF